MKRLILLRHAKSSWDEPGLADHERPLSGRGKRDAPLIGGRLRARQSRPSLIITSDAKRALKTAKLVAERWDYPREQLRIDARLYLASPAELLTVIGEQHDSLSSLLVVGHNPGLTELVNRLLPKLALANLPTAGVVAIDVEAAHWSEVPTARTELAFYDYPKSKDE